MPEFEVSDWSDGALEHLGVGCLIRHRLLALVVQIGLSFLRIADLTYDQITIFRSLLLWELASVYSALSTAYKSRRLYLYLSYANLPAPTSRIRISWAAAEAENCERNLVTLT